MSALTGPLRPAESIPDAVLDRMRQAQEGVATIFDMHLQGAEMAAVQRYRTPMGKTYVSIFGAAGGRIVDITAAVGHVLGEPVVLTSGGQLAISTEGVGAARLAEKVSKAMGLPPETIKFEVR